MKRADISELYGILQMMMSYGYWIPVTDSMIEGQWVDFYTSDPTLQDYHQCVVVVYTRSTIQGEILQTYWTPDQSAPALKKIIEQSENTLRDAIKTKFTKS